MWANRPLHIMTDDATPSTLLVINERNAHRRINDLLRRKGHEIENEPNGDRAVDAYVRMSKTSPPIVFLSLDVAGPLNGHLVGLEIREVDKNARLVYVCSRIRRKTAEDVAFSAGAVAILEMPFTMSDLDEAWPLIMGDIPDAPGVSDLDELYPDDGIQKIKVEDDDQPLTLPEPIITITEDTTIEVPITKPKKKSSRGKRLVIALLLFSLIGGLIWYFKDNLPI